VAVLATAATGRRANHLDEARWLARPKRGQLDGDQKSTARLVQLVSIVAVPRIALTGALWLRMWLMDELDAQYYLRRC
jgi:hypothetical protein